MKVLANCILASLLAVVGSAWGQTYPGKPIRFVAAGAPGTPPDLLTRTLTTKLNERLGWTTIVDPRPGDIAIPIMSVTSAPADGYSVLHGVMSMTIAASVKKDLPYDFQKDLQPVIKVANIPGVIVISTDLPVNNFRELVAYSKANPKKLSFGGSGEGTHSHLIYELLRLRQGLDAVYVPYKVQNAMALEIIGGRIQLAFSSLSEFAGNIQAAKLKPVMLIAPVRHPSVPDVPLATEITGDPGFATGSWFGLFIRSATPKPIAERLEKEMTAVMQAPDTKAQIQKIGFVDALQSSSQFAVGIDNDMKRWAQTIREANIKLD